MSEDQLSERKVWDLSKHPLGLPILNTCFEGGREGIVRALLPYLCEADLDNLKQASEGVALIFRDNLNYVPQPKWVCNEWHIWSSRGIPHAPCSPTAPVKACDGAKLGYNGRCEYSCFSSGDMAHDADHGVCAECNELALLSCIIEFVSLDGPSGRWRLPLKRTRGTANLKTPCTCLEDLRALNLCRGCREYHFEAIYIPQLQHDLPTLPLRNSSNVAVGDNLPPEYEDLGPPKKFQCYVCKGFIIGRTFVHGVYMCF
jgi:hypothetical protein